ncbi:MAG TPA: FAD-binding oxidoreductase [Steroidobacteraceae bacterium]|nr:FAD-binding oxidoreductase [Steroidobacteraceae bacterium]
MAQPSPYPPDFLADLTAIVGEDGLRQGEQLAGIDPGVHRDNLEARLMTRPATTCEVARLLALCSAARIGVVPQGGRTGLAGGAVTRPGQLIISLERMNRIEAVNAGARTATVEAGVTLERLEEALAPHGLVAGIDLGARSSATIGGMVATNAGGIEAFRYGTMRDRVLGLEVALPSGMVLEELARVRKDNAGLPLRQLFIGSEGTLGIVTRAVLALAPEAGPRQTILVLVPHLDAAVSVMRAVEARPETILTAAELMSGNHLALTARSLGITQVASASPTGFGLLLAVAGRGGRPAAEALEDALVAASEAGLITDALVPKNAAEERDLWRIREDWAVDRVRPGGLWYDVSVPIDALADYLSALETRIRQHDAGLEMYVVGHLADGNIHVTINASRPITERYAEIAPLIYEGLRAGGGSFSAEHGIGIEKRASLESWVGPTGISLMQAVKAVFDPAGIMNPGKVLHATGAETDWPDAAGSWQAGL